MTESHLTSVDIFFLILAYESPGIFLFQMNTLPAKLEVCLHQNTFTLGTDSNVQDKNNSPNSDTVNTGDESSSSRHHEVN